MEGSYRMTMRLSCKEVKQTEIKIKVYIYNHGVVPAPDGFSFPFLRANNLCSS